MTSETPDIDAAVAAIRQGCVGFAPRIVMMLGTGLGDTLADAEVLATLEYKELEGFHPSGVQSHKGRLLCCRFAGQDLLVMQGRFHLYEGHAASVMMTPMRVFHELGCKLLCVTNAANALEKEHSPPSLMLIDDHINAMHDNPLIGKDGNRFVEMGQAYDQELRRKLVDIAARFSIVLHRGVYYAMQGPCFETRAEARMARRFGAHAVGMSTVPEVLCARSLGMRVVGVTALTNFAADLSPHAHTVDEVIAGANAVAKDLGLLFAGFFNQLEE